MYLMSICFFSFDAQKRLCYDENAYVKGDGYLIRLIATDLDGTLLEPNGLLPQGIFETVCALRKLGIYFAASSGRQYGNLIRLFAPVADEMAFVCENGAVNMVDGKVAGIIAIPPQLVNEAIGDLSSLGMNILISGRETCYMLDQNRKFTDDIIYRLRNTVTIVENWEEIREPILKISGQIDSGVKSLAPQLLTNWSSRLTATVSGREWFDLTLANKGMGMQMLMKHLDVLPEETMAFGDNFNDESMLDCVGYPFLMQHADHALRKPGVRICEKVLSVLEAVVKAEGDPLRANFSAPCS